MTTSDYENMSQQSFTSDSSLSHRVTIQALCYKELRAKVKYKGQFNNKLIQPGVNLNLLIWPWLSSLSLKI